MLFVGAAEPEGFTITVNAGTSGRDLRTVIAASLFTSIVRGAAFVEWPIDIVSTTAATMVLRHIYASDGSDVQEESLYCQLRLQLEFPDGILHLPTIHTVAEER